jgi:hypothetical protein
VHVCMDVGVCLTPVPPPPPISPGVPMERGQVHLALCCVPCTGASTSSCTLGVTLGHCVLAHGCARESQFSFHIIRCKVPSNN